MRIYVPATLDELDNASVTATAARWTVSPRGAHAVTGALAAALPDDDVEGHEYAAFLAAAHDSLALVAGRPDVPPLRVVVSLEVPDSAVESGAVDAAGSDAAPSAVRVVRQLTVPVVAVHADEPEAAADVRAVLAAGDDDPAFHDALQRVTDRDLLWYDATEVHQIPRP